MTLTAVLVAWMVAANAAGPSSALGSQQAAVQQSAQSRRGAAPKPSGGGQQNGAPLDPDALPVSVDRIQKALEREPLIVLREPELNPDSGLPTFRIGVEGRKLTIDEILGPDYLRGPVPAGAMTHQEFLNMVTPTDVQGYAAFSNKQAATVAITSFAMQWALKTALKAYHDAKDARAKEAARKEVEEALEALRRARREAGLPDK
jgi:hypothetical protein